MLVFQLQLLRHSLGPVNTQEMNIQLKVTFQYLRPSSQLHWHVPLSEARVHGVIIPSNSEEQENENG